MLVLKNRSSYVEVRDGRDTIFRKNKPPNHGGLTGRLLASLGIVESGVYHVTFIRDAIHNPVTAIQFISDMNDLDGRKPNDVQRVDEATFYLQTWDKEVTKLM